MFGRLLGGSLTSNHLATTPKC